MKKTLFFLAAAFSVATLFSSCEKPEKEDDKKSDEVYSAGYGFLLYSGP